MQEGYELYGAQFGWGEGWIYTTTPPDCLDNNVVRDALLRDRAWMQTYGDNLPFNVRQEALRFMNWGIDYYHSYPCQSQIPFNP